MAGSQLGLNFSGWLLPQPSRRPHNSHRRTHPRPSSVPSQLDHPPRTKTLARQSPPSPSNTPLTSPVVRATATTHRRPVGVWLALCPSCGWDEERRHAEVAVNESASPGCRSRRRGRLKDLQAGLRVVECAATCGGSPTREQSASTSRCACPNDGCATRTELRTRRSPRSCASCATAASGHDDNSSPTSAPPPLGTHRSVFLSRLTIVPANLARLFFSRNLPTGMLVSLNTPAVQPHRLRARAA